MFNLIAYLLLAVLVGCVQVHVDNSPQATVTVTQTVSTMGTVPVSAIPGGLP